jgi:enolase
MGSEIVSIHGRRVWDSRGRATVEAEVRLATGAFGRAIAPAGASRGSREAVDLRDGGSRLGGNDVTRAIANISGEIAEALIGFSMPTIRPRSTPRWLRLDGTQDKARLGGNALIAVSLAIAQAQPRPRACHCGATLPATRPVSLPLPEIQIFGGGAHARQAHRHPGPDGRFRCRRRRLPRRSWSAPRCTARPAR